VTDTIELEVAYAPSGNASVIPLTVTPGTTVEAVIRQSGILEQHPEIDITTQALGIFAKTCQLSDIPVAGDRLELYRPLMADPKEVRRRRADLARARKQATKNL